MTATLRPGPSVGDTGAARPRPPEVRASSRAVDPELVPRWGLEVALALLTLTSLAGFHRVFSGSSWVGPVLGTALAVQAVCRLTRRYVPQPLVAGLIDLVAVVAVTAWTVLPSSTTVGLPLSGTWHAVHQSLLGLADRMQSATVPTPPVTGFLLLATLGAGIVALAGSWIAFRLARVLPAVLPSVAAVVACSCLGTRAGRGWAVALEIAAAGAFVLVAGVGDRAAAGWFAARRRGADRLVGSGVPLVATALVAGLAVVPFVAPADGHGLLGWRSQGSATARSVFSPLVSLQTRLLTESSTPVFQVESPVRSYWRLTSLDDFNGTSWSARDTYEGVHDKLPGLGAAPSDARVVTEHFQVQTLASVWLPLAFEPRSVTGAGSVSYDASSGSLLTARQTSDGLDYTVTSLQYLDTLSPTALASAPAVTTDSSTAPYLALPASVPAQVRDLARTIVAGKRTEYAKALALQQYFHGPSFTYSLHPPSDGVGDGALETFLFDTRTGYCQQFAGAYAVLARAVGIPTRLAVGFTSGTPVGGDRYQVTDADAHVWPEVWFPRYGWVPFEPTKGAPGAGFTIPGATGYTGNTAATTSTGPAPPTATTPSTTVPSTSPVTTPTGAPGPVDPTTHVHALRGPSAGAGVDPPLPRSRPARGRARSGHVLLALLAVLAAGIAVVAVDAAGRRVRWALRRRAVGRIDPGARYGPIPAAAVWDEVAEQLAWHGIRRQAAETPRQFAARVAEDRRLDGEAPLGAHLRRLADVLTAADYGPDGVSGADLAEAAAGGRRIANALRRDLSRWERARIVLDPRLAWAPVTVDAAGPVGPAVG